MYRIYIVEDDRDIAGVLKKHISSWGFEVACSENFQNILAEFVDFDPQLVLMDITLPFYLQSILQDRLLKTLGGNILRRNAYS